MITFQFYAHMHEAVRFYCWVDTDQAPLKAAMLSLAKLSSQHKVSGAHYWQAFRHKLHREYSQDSMSPDARKVIQILRELENVSPLHFSPVTPGCWQESPTTTRSF